MKLTNAEKETIFLANEQDTAMEIYTHNDKLRRTLADLSERYPELYKVTSTDQYGGMSFSFAKKLMTVKFKEPPSPEKQAEINKRMEKMRGKKTVK